MIELFYKPGLSTQVIRYTAEQSVLLARRPGIGTENNVWELKRCLKSSVELIIVVIWVHL